MNTLVLVVLGALALGAAAWLAYFLLFAVFALLAPVGWAMWMALSGIVEMARNVVMVWRRSQTGVGP